MRISDWSSDVCSSDLGDSTDQSSGQWGGVVLLGRAKITDCGAPAAAPGTTACERDTEGTSKARYGGANDADSSGRMRYVQIRYSVLVLSGRSDERRGGKAGISQCRSLWELYH